MMRALADLNAPVPMTSAARWTASTTRSFFDHSLLPSAAGSNHAADAQSSRGKTMARTG